ncbi:hypothetical protein MSG28_003317 [Choristoneura fumiferana]|uniref:Uncharacterized protein n=2 Tax=Choristoneura fumiferana TaxID=7141 RepID=A0ACC0KFB2_CHOFU|nr:hypothetical protein MSG28_003317 [Choristoneura fumiferana]KAI8434807.1 hypothetical protein MSG28_003317 [Choristoneura fumiferana]
MGQHYHPVVALMENRRQHLYRAVLQKVWELAGNPEPETVLSDYEPALQGALREVTDAPLQGCYFHFLQRGRQEHVPMRLVRLYATLALLPAERAPAAFAAQTDAAMFLQIPLNHAYHLYFRDYWMNIALDEQEVLQQKFAVCASRRQASLAGAYLPQRRARPGVLVKQNVVAGNLEALARATITLREFLVMTSQAIVVGAGLAANDVPDVAEEVEVEMDAAVAAESRPATPEHQGPARCGVCRENPPARVLIPCGHTLCGDCLNGVEESLFGTSLKKQK